MQISYSLNKLPGDVFGGVTAAIVALPVALAFGIASGLGPIAGLYSAIAVGFFAAVFGGTPTQISSPTPPMTVAMAVIITQHSSTLGEAFTIVILAGLIQIGLGALKIGSFVTYTPYSVISGFTSGIGIIVIVIQALPFLGGETAPGGTLDSIVLWPEALLNINWQALALGAISLLAVILWPNTFSRFLPGPLVALVIGTTIGYFWLTGAPTIGEIPSGFPDLIAPTFSPSFLASAVEPALILAIIGSIDSLLTSLVADSMTRTRHNPDRELFGQGLGNMIAGAIGALPGAGTTLGTVINIQAGATTFVSGALRAIILLVVVLMLGQVVEPIPHAVLAGLLMKVGWDIIDWRFLTRVRHISPPYLLVMLATLLLTVFVDLVTAVAVGLIASTVLRARQSEQLELDNIVSAAMLDHTFFADVLDEEELAEIDVFQSRVGLLRMNGGFTAASANEMVRVVSADIEEHEIVIFDFSDTVYMDDSAALVMGQLVDAAIEESTECIVMNMTGSVSDVLYSFNAFMDVPEGHFVQSMEDAKYLAKEILDSKAA